MFVEAHTVGQDDWTTLPDENGNTSQALDPAAGSCSDGWAAPDGQHPFLAHYMNPDTCAPTGTTGEWNAATGNSGGYQDWEIDLSDFAGSQVEVSIAYATDPFVQGLGVFVDDTEVLSTACRARRRRSRPASTAGRPVGRRPAACRTTTTGSGRRP